MNQQTKRVELIRKANKLLVEHRSTTYNSKEIVELLNEVDCKISTSFYSKILKQGKGQLKNLVKVFDGLCRIIERELYMQYDEDEQIFKLGIGTNDSLASIAEKRNTKTYARGRLTIAQKVTFLQNAQSKVIFFGVRLKQLTAYFKGRKREDFKQPILELLEKGVDIDCYFLNPDALLTQRYFEDRSNYLQSEGRSLLEMKLIVQDLKEIIDEFDQQDLKGQFRLYTYEHIPHGYYLLIDGERKTGKMHISHYLFGTARSESPVFEVVRKEQPLLFEKYYYSFQLLVKDATLLDATTSND